MPPQYLGGDVVPEVVVGGWSVRHPPVTSHHRGIGRCLCPDHPFHVCDLHQRGSQRR